VVWQEDVRRTGNMMRRTLSTPPANATYANTYWDRLYSPVTHGIGVLWDNGGPDADLVAALDADKLYNAGAALDVGCGQGNDAILMLQHFPIVVCLDASGAALAIAKVRAEDAPSAGRNLTLVHAFLGASDNSDVAVLNQGQRYAFVWIRSVLQHVPDEVALRMLSHLRSFMQPDGVLMIKEMVVCPGQVFEKELHCSQWMGTASHRPPELLVSLVRQVFPSCAATAASFDLQCDGTHLCAQLFRCTHLVPSPPPALLPSKVSSLPLQPGPLLVISAAVLLAVALCLAAWRIRRRCRARRTCYQQVQKVSAPHGAGWEAEMMSGVAPTCAIHVT